MSSTAMGIGVLSKIDLEAPSGQEDGSRWCSDGGTTTSGTISALLFKTSRA
jgi:hypothetical protein